MMRMCAMLGDTIVHKGHWAMGAKQERNMRVLMIGLLASAMGVSACAGETADKYDTAMAGVIEMTETRGKTMYNGSYFTTKMVSPEHCQLDKVVSYYDKTNALEKIATTSFALGQIDPKKIMPDHLGGIKFWSLGEAPIFHLQHSQGGDFSADIPGDNFTVRDEDTETTLLIKALKTLVLECAAK